MSNKKVQIKKVRKKVRLQKQVDKSHPKKKDTPGFSLEAREAKLVTMAVDMAEEQIKNRTASSQVLTHYLKLGSVQAQVELQKLKSENTLLQAKTESLKSQAKTEELYQQAIKAMHQYQGHREVDDDNDD
jgi:hypothetical protein